MSPNAPRQLGWIAATLAIVAAIEITVGIVWPRPAALRNNFLAWSFAKPDQVQRAFVAEKVLRFDDAKPDVLQVGDSSGFHGVQPPIVESYLGGRRYLNMSVATNLGFDGHAALARRIMERSGTVKLVVLYFAPGGGHPRPFLVGARDLMADDVQREFASPLHRLLQWPTLAVRREVADRVFYLNGLLNTIDRPPTTNSAFPMTRDIIAASGGWAMEMDNPENTVTGLMQGRHTPAAARIDDAVVIDALRQRLGVVGVDWKLDWGTLRWRTYIDIVLGQWLEMARAQGARLAIVVNPIPEAFRSEAYKSAFDTAGVSAELRRFVDRHPDALLLDGDYWPNHKFSVFSHVATPYSVESSHRVGRYLEQVARHLPPPAGQMPAPIAPAHVVIDMAASPSLYGFSHPVTEKPAAASDAPAGRAPRSYRTIREGWFEGLVHTRVRTDGPLELRIAVIDTSDEALLGRIGLGVYGVRAERLPDLSRDGGRWLRFILPDSEVRRFGGWIELTLSTRDLVSWQDGTLHADATGPRLKIERIEIAPP